MGKHSGRHAFRKKLEELGVPLEGDVLEDAFHRFKDLADKKKEIYDQDIVALVDEEERENDHIRLISLHVVAGTSGPQEAKIELEIDGETRSHTANGDGPVDATFKAVAALVPNEAILQLYQVHAVTAGMDAQAEVTVRLVEAGKSVNGQGANTDTLVASAKAYINALNKLLVKRQKHAPGALSA